MGFLFGKKPSSPDFVFDRVKCIAAECDQRAGSETEPLWICVVCLDVYCSAHNQNLYFYEPDFGMSSTFFVGGSLLNRMSQARNAQKKLDQFIAGWAEEMFRKGHDVTKWGTASEFNGYLERREGFILCRGCADRLKRLKMHDRVTCLDDTEMRQEFVGQFMDTNLFGNYNYSDEQFGRRLAQRFG